MDPEVQRQIAWEMETVTLGVERYRRSIAETALGDTDPGLALLRGMLADRPDPEHPGELLPGFVTAIAAAKQAAIARETGAVGRGKSTTWNLLANFLTPEKIAVIAARSLLTSPRVRDIQGIPFTKLAGIIARNVKLEIEYEDWVRRENEAQKADPEYLNIYKLLVSRYRKPVDSRVFRRWKRKLKTIQDHPIDPITAVQYGTHIISLMLEFGGGMFQKRIASMRGGKRGFVIFMRPETRQALYEHHAKLEITRPYLLPMRCPPKPWTRANLED